MDRLDYKLFDEIFGEEEPVKESSPWESSEEFELFDEIFGEKKPPQRPDYYMWIGTNPHSEASPNTVYPVHIIED